MRRCFVILLATAALAVIGCAGMQRVAAPKFETKGVHEGAARMSEEQCFSCHREGKDGAPKAPAAMYGRKNCGGCHLK